MLPVTPTGFSANMPSITMAMWLTDEYATSLFQSFWASATSAPYTMPMSDSTTIIGTKWRDASGRIGRLKRRNPYVPIFSRTAARITEPAVGASVCASGSHVWNGNIGTLIANPRKNARNTHHCSVEANRYWWYFVMSNEYAPAFAGSLWYAK